MRWTTDMYHVHCDVSITRRKKYHLIMDDHDQVAFRARDFSEIIGWLYENSEFGYLLYTPERRYYVSFRRDPVENGDN